MAERTQTFSREQQADHDCLQEPTKLNRLPRQFRRVSSRYGDTWCVHSLDTCFFSSCLFSCSRHAVCKLNSINNEACSEPPQPAKLLLPGDKAGRCRPLSAGDHDHADVE